ncbi:hypothetical protein CDEN61S_02703 [Castellaniella denitrificans]
MNISPLNTMNSNDWFVKVTAITLSFWIIKVMSTTVGETAADFLAVNAGLGQVATRTLMAVLLIAALTVQLRRPRYTPWAYWLTVVLVSIVERRSRTCSRTVSGLVCMSARQSLLCC